MEFVTTARFLKLIGTWMNFQMLLADGVENNKYHVSLMKSVMEVRRVSDQTAIS